MDKAAEKHDLRYPMEMFRFFSSVECADVRAIKQEVCLSDHEKFAKKRTVERTNAGSFQREKTAMHDGGGVYL